MVVAGVVVLVRQQRLTAQRVSQIVVVAGVEGMDILHQARVVMVRRVEVVIV
jgi:hypothetical protein